MHLGPLVGSRDNNFNLLRLLASLVVVVSHSFHVVLGSEPWHLMLGSTPGRMAVDVFFVISGFLVTRSLEYRRDVLEFACARAMRILPGLAVNLVFVALVVGAVFATIPPSDYYADSGLLTYIFRNLQILVLPIPFNDLPGVRVENGSLWTLTVEVCCYILLLCGWVAWRHARGSSRVDVVVLGITAIIAGWALRRYFQIAGFHLAWMFTSGVLAYYFRDRIKLSGRVAVVALLILLLSTSQRTAFQALLLLAGPYLIFCAAYLPGGRIRKFNRLGDYSYGVYIYGMPMQFVVHQVVPSAGVVAHIAMAVPLVLAVAAVSWHFVERPSLNAIPRIIAVWRRSIAPKAVSGST